MRVDSLVEKFLGKFEWTTKVKWILVQQGSRSSLIAFTARDCEADRALRALLEKSQRRKIYRG